MESLSARRMSETRRCVQHVRIAESRHNVKESSILVLWFMFWCGNTHFGVCPCNNWRAKRAYLCSQEFSIYNYRSVRSCHCRNVLRVSTYCMHKTHAKYWTARIRLPKMRAIRSSKYKSIPSPYIHIPHCPHSKMSEEGLSSPTRPRGFQDFMSTGAKGGRKKRTLPIAPHRRNKGDTDEDGQPLHKHLYSV